VYDAYDQPVRVWGLSVTADQQIAGAIMKTGGSIFLWSIIVTLWFTRFAARHGDEYDYHRPLTYDDVEREFAKAPAVREQ
jgi:putative membrane protein